MWLDAAKRRHECHFVAASSHTTIFPMLTPAEAEKLIFAQLAPFPREDCPLAQAHGRILRADLCADYAGDIGSGTLGQY